MKKLKGLVIGDPMVDVYHYGKAIKISAEAPIPVFKKEKTEYRLGGSLNIAHNLQSFCEIDFLSEKLIKMSYLKDPELFICEDNYGSFASMIQKHRFIDIDYNIHVGIRFDEDFEYEDPFIPNDIPIKEYDFILLSDYNKGTIGRNFLRLFFDKIILLPKRQKPVIFLDTKTDDFDKYSQFVTQIDYFKCNEKEFDKYYNYYCNLIRDNRFSNIFITSSQDGISFLNEEENMINNKLKSFCEKPVDVTGAGDSSMVGLIYGYFNISSKSINARHLYMANCANAFAKMACENPGTFVMTEENIPEIKKILVKYAKR